MRAVRGFGFIEILFVVLILSLLIGGFSYFGSLTESSGTAESTLTRAEDTGCAASRHAVEANIEMWLVSHAGEPISGDIIRAAGISTRCPHSRHGGTYVYIDGTVHCTDHLPPPAGAAAAPRPALPPTPSSAPSALDSQSGDVPAGRPEAIPGVRLPPMP